MKKKTTNKIKSQMTKYKNQQPRKVKEAPVMYAARDIGKIQIIKDFLPHPDDLVLKDATVKVTLNLSRSSVEFFKVLAQKNGSQYQKVIRNLLDTYSSNFAK